MALDPRDVHEKGQRDAFAAARLWDSFKVLEERQAIFEVVGHEHIATQDLSGGGEIVETITIRWRVKPPVNGHSHGDLAG